MRLVHVILYTCSVPIIANFMNNVGSAVGLEVKLKKNVPAICFSFAACTPANAGILLIVK